MYITKYWRHHMKILNQEITEKTKLILDKIISQLSFPIEYNYSCDETSYAYAEPQKYYVNLIHTSGKDFEDNLLHECSHLLQFENHFPMIKVSSTISKENRYIISTIQNIVLDQEVRQTMNKYGYTILKQDIKFKTYYPLFKKIKKSLPPMPEFNIQQYALEIAYIYIFDSKTHAEQLLNCTDISTYSVRKLTYSIVECFNHYPQITQDNISSLYSELIGCFNISNNGYVITE